MKAGAGKGKGNAFERVCCKKLSRWLTNGKRDDVLWRSAISGGRATVHAKRGNQMAHVAGDICAVHESGQLFASRYYTECKAYRNLGFAQLVTKGDGTLAKFWEVAKTRAKEHGKAPLLIFKQNQFPVMVGVKANSSGDFGTLTSRVYFKRNDLVLFDFENFVRFATPPMEQQDA